MTVTLGESDRKNDSIQDGALNPQEMSVLVVDDDPIALDSAQIILRQVGISCEIAESGADALEMVKIRHARREDYDLLLIDWKMPDMDGVETTRQIRAVVGNEGRSHSADAEWRLKVWQSQSFSRSINFL